MDRRGSLIELRSVSKAFETRNFKVEAVKNVSLIVKENEIFGIIGASGAGKSTLIRCLNLLEVPDTGEVIVEGKNLLDLNQKELHAARRKIGMIFQHFHLLSSRTIVGNVEFPMRGNGLSKGERKEKALSLLKLVGLEDRANSYPSQLSGGQKQRVAIARALANDPKILLCDEGTSALDPQTTQSVLALLKELNQKLNLTIVLITHELSVIKDICDSVAIMSDGEIIESGPIIDIFANPKSEHTKEFIQSATTMEKAYQLIASDEGIMKRNPGEILLQLSYAGASTDKALISYLSTEFKVECNILFGNIEMIGSQPFGWLIVAISGANSKEAIAYLKKQEVKVEVIKQC